MLNTIKTQDSEIIKEIGYFCKKFRVDYMNLSMTEFAERRGLKVGNVNAFERGTANNIIYLLHYFDEADADLRDFFTKNVFEIYRR